MTNSISSANDIPMVLTVPEVAHYLRISRNTAYDLVRSGQIKSILVGRQIRISKNSFLEFIAA